MLRCRAVLLVIFVLASLLATSMASAQHAPREQSVGKAGWSVFESTNFRVYVATRAASAESLTAKCEALRSHLQETWLGAAQHDWPSPCDIVLHATGAGYRHALGAGSERSSGCATIEIEPGRVLKRRIDLRADAADWLNSALPHELTHVIIAERFTRRQIPRWADEGLAILSESATKQQRRQSAMTTAMAGGAGFSAAELLSLSTYPPGPRLDAFYGQSASLVACLIERESPDKFLRFVEESAELGLEQALARVYGWNSFADLDRHWKPRLFARGEPAELLAGRLERITSGRLPD